MYQYLQILHSRAQEGPVFASSAASPWTEGLLPVRKVNVSDCRQTRARQELSEQVSEGHRERVGHARNYREQTRRRRIGRRTPQEWQEREQERRKPYSWVVETVLVSFRNAEALSSSQFEPSERITERPFLVPHAHLGPALCGAFSCPDVSSLNGLGIVCASAIVDADEVRGAVEFGFA
jgi:hypothetical protein